MRKKRIFALYGLMILIFSISCISETNHAENGKNIEGQTELVSQTPTAMPSKTPSPLFTVTATVYGSLMPPTPDASMQTYVDPEGWYQVQFPAEFTFNEQRQQYMEGGRYFETGYLPELGSMSSGLNVCIWLVNVMEAKPEEYQINWMAEGSCEITSQKDAYHNIRMMVYENPGADIAHRFFYTKTNGWISRGSDVPIRFSWIKPIEDIKFVNYDTDFSVAPEGWENLGALMNGVKVTEIELAPGIKPYHEGQLQGLNGEDLYAWMKDDFARIPEPTPQWVKTPIPDLGYAAGYDTAKRQDGSEFIGLKFTRDGRVLFDNVDRYSRFYYVENGEDSFATCEVITYLNEAFLIQNDVIHPWISRFQDPRHDAVIYQKAVLWLKAGEGSGEINVIKTDPRLIETIFTWQAATEPMFTVDEFILYHDQWVIAAKDFLIKDGMVINEELGVQEIFNWKLINDEEFFFFRKDGRLGFSYGGEYFPMPYQDMARYMCCGYSINNPIISYHEAHFFAMRDGVWYYVIIEY